MKVIVTLRDWSPRARSRFLEVFGSDWDSGPVEVPDDLPSFMELVNKFGRVEFTRAKHSDVVGLETKNLYPDMWVLYFQNDYD